MIEFIVGALTSAVVILLLDHFRKPTKMVLSTNEHEEKTDKLTLDEQFDNLFKYDGRKQ